MKILQVGSAMPDDWGGIERYVSYLAPGLVDLGHEVVVACVPGSPLAGRLGGVSRVPVRVRRRYDFGAVAKYLRLFRQTSFDLGVVHYSPDYWAAATAAKIASGPKMVMTRHVAVPFKPGRVKGYLKLYQRFIGVSEAVSEGMVSVGVPQDRVKTVLGGIPGLVCRRDRALVRKELGVEGFAVGIFGRYVKEKGQMEGIEAMMGRAGLGGGVSVHLFGRGPYRDEIMKFVTSKGWHRQVIDHGYVDDVAEAMAAMDVVLVPSIWEEAFGLTAVEAMSLGVPVVGFATGGLSEVLADGGGIGVPELNVDAMGAAVARLGGDEEYRLGVGEAGRRAWAERFTVAGLCERSAGAYGELVGIGG